MRIEIKNKEVRILKDCKECDHYKTCKFISSYKNFVKQNNMNEMTYYSEHNNLNLIFELYAKCQYYSVDYSKKGIIDGPVTLDSSSKIIEDVIYDSLKLRNIRVLQRITDDINKTTTILSDFQDLAKGKPKEEHVFEISELIEGYTIVI